MIDKVPISGRTSETRAVSEYNPILSELILVIKHGRKPNRLLPWRSHYPSFSSPTVLESNNAVKVEAPAIQQLSWFKHDSSNGIWPGQHMQRQLLNRLPGLQVHPWQCGGLSSNGIARADKTWGCREMISICRGLCNERCAMDQSDNMLRLK